MKIAKILPQLFGFNKTNLESNFPWIISTGITRKKVNIENTLQIWHRWPKDI